MVRAHPNPEIPALPGLSSGSGAGSGSPADSTASHTCAELCRLRALAIVKFKAQQRKVVACVSFLEATGAINSWPLQTGSPPRRQRPR